MTGNDIIHAVENKEGYCSFPVYDKIVLRESLPGALSPSRNYARKGFIDLDHRQKVYEQYFDPRAERESYWALDIELFLIGDWKVLNS